MLMGPSFSQHLLNNTSPIHTRSSIFDLPKQHHLEEREIAQLGKQLNSQLKLKSRVDQ